MYYRLRECPYVAYYRDQAGLGVSTVYAGAQSQKGHGIGSFLGSLFRWVSPFLKRGAIALGNKAVNVGGKVLADVASGENVKQSLKRRFKEVQEGQGIKRRKIGKKAIRTSDTRRAVPLDQLDQEYDDGGSDQE